MSKGAGQTLRKHLASAGITSWEDITRASLYDLRDKVTEAVAPSTAKTIMAYAKSLLNRYQEAVNLPSDWQKILSVKGATPTKTYLTESELASFAKVLPDTKKQRWVQNVFLICAYTGLRVGDAMRITPENIVGGNLHYVAEKTKKAGAIPLKRGLAERIKWVAEHPELAPSLVTYNQTVRDIAKAAGIDSEVVVEKAGKEERGPKWKFLSSHTARISTATCLARRGVSTTDISALLQHTSVQTTQRYIVRDHIELSPTAMQFFQ